MTAEEILAMLPDGEVVITTHSGALARPGVRAVWASPWKAQLGDRIGMGDTLEAALMGIVRTYIR